MKRLTCIAMLVLLLLTALPTHAESETVTVRLDFSRFNRAVLTTPLSGRDYHDFEQVDADTTIMIFQEFILKEAFPELSEYGKSAEKVLAYTDRNGLLYDGVHDTVGSIADRLPEDEGVVMLYLWEGMHYLQWSQGGKPIQDSDAFVYNFLEESVHPPTASGESGADTDVLFSGVVGTDMVLNQVFINRESIFFSVRKGDIPMLFTQAIGDAPTGGLRLTLSVLESASGLRLHYNQEALQELEALSFTEVVLVIGDKEQVFTMDTLKGA